MDIDIKKHKCKMLLRVNAKCFCVLHDVIGFGLFMYWFDHHRRSWNVKKLHHLHYLLICARYCCIVKVLK